MAGQGQVVSGSKPGRTGTNYRNFLPAVLFDEPWGRFRVFNIVIFCKKPFYPADVDRGFETGAGAFPLAG